MMPVPRVLSSVGRVNHRTWRLDLLTTAACRNFHPKEHLAYLVSPTSEMGKSWNGATLSFRWLLTGQNRGQLTYIFKEEELCHLSMSTFWKG